MHVARGVFTKFVALVSISAAAACARDPGTTNDAGAGGGNVRASPLIISAATPRPRTGTWSVNYWTWPVTYGNPIAGTESRVAALKPALMRVGGYNNDANTPDPFNDAEVDRMIAYARAIGAEPIIQVPNLAGVDGRPPTAASAAEMVTYANVTKGYHVKYFSVGNEPDLYAMQGNPSAPMQPARPGYSPADYCATATAFVAEMKAADPTITIIGPDLAYQYQFFADFLSPVLRDCGDLFDIVSIHRYPFSASQATLAAAAVDVAAFRSVIGSVRDLMRAAGQGDKPLALTEMNIAYDATPAGTMPGAAPGTVPAALWFADALGAALDLGLWTTATWDISDDENWALGLLALPPAHTPRPQYYAYSLYSDHYGPTLIDVTSAPPGVSAYASRNAAADATEVIVVNWNTSPAALAFQVTGLAQTPQPPIFQLPALSIAAVEIRDDGVAAAWSYGEEQHGRRAGPEPLAPGAGTIADGGQSHEAGADVSDGPATQCPRAIPTSTDITTLGRAAGGAIMFGAGAAQWGSFTYAGNGQPLPTATPTDDGNGLAISATFVSPVVEASDFEGVGLYFSSASCLDASAYTGIAFDFSGDLGGCNFGFGVSASDDVSVINDPVRGLCTAGLAGCYAPYRFFVPGSTRIQVPFSSLASGMPADKVDVTTIISIAWELTAPLDAGGCTASFTVSNAAFY